MCATRRQPMRWVETDGLFHFLRSRCRSVPCRAQKGPANDPQLLKGKAVRKKFGRRWYNGSVESCTKANGYRIKYEDGDVEELWADDVTPLLCQMA